jgi:hypothetical protein
VADWEITSIYLESLLFVNRPKSELIKSAESVYSEIEDKSLMFGFMGQLYKKAGMLEKNIDYMKIAVDYYVLEKNVAEQHATRAFIVEMMAEGNHKDRFEKRTLLDVTVDKKFITGPKALFDKKTGFYRRDGHYFFTTIQIKVKDIASVERIYHNIYTYVFILSKTSKSIIISDGYKTDYSRIGRMGDDEELIKLIKSAMISANNI